MHLCEQNYKSFDIEKILLEILDEFHEVFEDNVRSGNIPDFKTIEKQLIKTYELTKLPVELTPKMYFQSAIICGFLDLELALNVHLEKKQKKKQNMKKMSLSALKCLKMTRSLPKSRRKNRRKNREIRNRASPES